MGRFGKSQFFNSLLGVLRSYPENGAMKIPNTSVS